MTFMSSLAANPSGGVYGQPKQISDDDVLGIVNQMKDREMHDFKDKATFMADLSNRQERMRALFDPSGPTGGQNANPQASPGGQQGQMNTVMAQDPNQITPYQKGELGIRQQGLNIESQRLAQQGKMGEEALGIKAQQEKLNQQKSDQIHEQKMKELTTKQDEYKQKMDLATQQLQDKNLNFEKQLELHKIANENMKAYHDAEMSKKDLEFERRDNAHKDTIKEMQKKLDAGNRVHQEKKDSAGNVITTDTTKGDAAEMVDVVGPDGRKGKIPKDKLDDWNKKHAPQPQEEQ